MDFSEYSRQTLEEIWRVRLHAAQQRAGLALADFKKVEQEWRAQMQPEDRLAMSEALTRESVARRKYIRTLRVFTNLVVNGKRPPVSFDGDE